MDVNADLFAVACRLLGEAEVRLELQTQALQQAKAEAEEAGRRIVELQGGAADGEPSRPS